MKTIDITIKGTLYCCDFCSEEEKDQEDFNYESFMLIEPDTIEVEGTVYQKDDFGEYPWTVKQSPFFEYTLQFYEWPLHMWLSIIKDEVCVYQLTLEDNEEFDISKLQLIQSYELNVLEDAALYSCIYYDGRDVEMSAEEDDNHVYSPIRDLHAWEYEIEGFDDEVTEDDPDYIKVPWAEEE